MNRRAFIKVLIFISSILSFKIHPSQKKPNTSFNYGVASGDPTNEKIILWTKITTNSNKNIQVRWELSKDKKFNKVLSSGFFIAKKINNFSVKIDVKVPQIYRGKDIFYRFNIDDIYSDTGKTKTLPINDPEKYNIGFCSCSNHPAGYFNAYREMANNNEIDLVLHLGDYIYEYDSSTELLSQFMK